ncbi:class I SAM-dependent methyltransferase [Microbulbifer aggregans]|uniref:class I SAM-dependent methyltransferase n=1 Tax=Microbulbifer aggregans TaxID=1769779 RepID=UPI001CFD0CD8|nr:methyltransferase [Microbulbifer aggregans]
MKFVHWLAGMACAVSLAGAVQAEDLQKAIAAETRSPANAARDVYRHPEETLTFFQVQPEMTVVEIWPGGGWYSEILAPLMHDKGTYYAAHFDKTAPGYFKKSRENFEEKIKDKESVYSDVILTEFIPGGDAEIAPAGSADAVLTFRNVHNWMNQDKEAEAFKTFYDTLKPGGVLGVVEHRAKPGTSREDMVKSGYVTQDYVIGLAEKAGFVLEEASEINANAKDTANHPKGVWTLPPSLGLGDEDKSKYLAIGESDRMTLRFRKPKA